MLGIGWSNSQKLKWICAALGVCFWEEDFVSHLVGYGNLCYGAVHVAFGEAFGSWRAVR